MRDRARRFRNKSRDEPPLPKRQIRRRFIQRHVDLTGKVILEVGAFDGPTFRGPAAPAVSYLDWFTRDELIVMHEEKRGHGRNLDNAVEVDHVVKKKRFAADIPDRFDLIVANHVIEHIADPITWLEQLAVLARPGGHLFLSVPDRRFTFDYLRPDATVVDLLRAHEEDLERPSVWQILDGRFHYRPLKPDDFKEGVPSAEKLERRRMSLDEAYRSARTAAESYADVHCFAYTAQSFGTMMSDLAEAGMLSWAPVAVDDATPGLREFHVLLERTPQETAELSQGS